MRIHLTRGTVFAVLAAGAVAGLSLLAIVPRAIRMSHANMGAVFPDEPRAHALLDKMLNVLQTAQTLSYESDLKWNHGRCGYRVWLKKPDSVRVEALGKKGEIRGTLVGDSDVLWIHWPGKRPHFAVEDADYYGKTCYRAYLQQPKPPTGHYVKAEMPKLVSLELGPPVIDPSIFLGRGESLLGYLDGVRNLGRAQIDGENCVGIEVSFMRHQRSWYLWIAERDSLPRKLKEHVRADKDVITSERWSNIIINSEIVQERFVWVPPADWTQLHFRSSEESLLRPGREAPDFELRSATGAGIRLSDYRGQVVWLTFWRVGCPPCREEMPDLEALYRRNRDKGFTILGYNFADSQATISEMLESNHVTFPNVADSSEAAQRIALDAYNAAAVPTNYIIDRRGRIAEAWLGYEKSDDRGTRALERQGIQ
jgi:peroxiredoxin